MSVPEGRKKNDLRELRRRVDDGTYRIDARAVADAILDGGWIPAAPSEPRSQAGRPDAAKRRRLPPPLAA